MYTYVYTHTPTLGYSLPYRIVLTRDVTAAQSNKEHSD